MSNEVDELNEGQKLESPASAEASTTPSSSVGEGEKLPFDKDPKWLSARADQKKLQETMSDNGYSSEEQEQFFIDLATNRALQKEVGNRDIKSIIDGSENWTKYQEWEREQKVFKERDEELPEDRASRLEQELRNLMSNQDAQDKSQLEEQQNKQLKSKYNNRVENFIDNRENISDVGKQLLREIFTEGGLLSYGLDDKNASNKAMLQVAKMFDELGTDYVNRYREGKLDIPTMTSVQDSTTSMNKGEAPKTVKDATKILKEVIAAQGKNDDFWR